VWHLLLGHAIHARDLLEQAEEEWQLEQHVMDSFSGSAAQSLDSSWASGMSSVLLGEDGVEDEVLPYIAVGDVSATLMDGLDGASLFQSLGPQLRSGGRLDVLENQLVVISGLTAKAEDSGRNIEAENVLASELACRSINGTAMFMLVHRHPLKGSPHTHELAYFDAALWDTFIEYMERARTSAGFFGGPEERWALRIHWQVLPHEQRVPFELSGPSLATVAQPTLTA